jgi:ComF family protein
VLASLGRSLLDLVYPPRCVLCRAAPADDVGALCPACAQRLPVLCGPQCPRCARPIHTRDGADQLCGACRLHPRAALDRVAAAGEYYGGMRLLIHLYKYRRCQFLAAQLALLLRARPSVAALLAETDWLAPIPLHWMRQRWRGFNQAREIGRCLTNWFGVPLLPPGDFRRVRRTTPQVQLSASGRAANIRGAFAVRTNARIRQTRVTLLDDVLTTGATAHECARTLRAAGAARVNLLVVAR